MIIFFAQVFDKNWDVNKVDPIQANWHPWNDALLTFSARKREHFPLRWSKHADESCSMITRFHAQSFAENCEHFFVRSYGSNADNAYEHTLT